MPIFNHKASSVILNKPRQNIPNQQGMALLTILLLVVAITIVAGSMLASQKIMLRQYELTKTQGDFKEYVLAGEAYAIQLIAQDSQVNQIDSLKDNWAKTIPDYPIQNGKLKIKIDDESNRFNINNLYHNNKVDTQALAYLKALLQSNDISPNVAMAILDWQDPDSDTSQNGGAETDFYQSGDKSKPVTIANQPFTSLDELQYVRGMDSQKLEKIRPLLTVVPFFLPMNVNTMKPELLSLIPVATMQNTASQATANTQSNPASSSASQTTTPTSVNSADIAAITNWANQRANQNPIQSMKDFWSLSIFNSLASAQGGNLDNLFDVQSRAFRVYITVDVNGKQTFFTSQIAKTVDKSNTVTLNSAASATSQNNLSKDSEKITAYHRQFLPFPPKF